MTGHTVAVIVTVLCAAPFVIFVAWFALSACATKLPDEHIVILEKQP